MAAVRYESVLVEQALAREYSSELESALRKMEGLNDIKGLVRDFEKQFADYIGVKGGVAVNSGSDALKMALLACGVGPGDEVIVPDLTYQAVALAVFYCGARPVSVDASKKDLQIDAALIEKSLTKKTKAVVAAHMFGRPCDVKKISELCRLHKIAFIEDVCQAESSKSNGRMLGSFGNMAVFSFSYYKPLSSCGGGGGMVICNNDTENRIRRWMEDWRNDDELLKTGQRFAPMSLMDLIALRVKFSHLKKIIASRHQIKAFYEKELGSLKGLTIFKDRPQTESVAQNFVICLPQRDGLVDYLNTAGIMVQKPYLALHQMEVLKGNKKEFPVSQWYSAQALHLPLYSFMSLDKAKTVVECCRAFMEENRS